MSEDAVASVQAAEILRLRAENGDLAALLRAQGVEMLDMRDRVRALEAENKRLERDNDGLDDIIADQSRWIGHHKDRILALEAEIAVLRGTMARPEPDDDGPVTLVEGPPNAPR